MRNFRNQIGFSIIELMVAVAILGILAAIAIPNYSKYLERSRRVDAQTILLKVAAEQEKYYLENNTYGTTAQIAAGIKTSTTTINSPNNYYSIVIASKTATQDFTATASVISTGAQAGDSDCAKFSIDQAGTRTAKTSANADNTTKCWK